jgi:transposase
MDSPTEIISQVARRRRWATKDKVRLLELAMQPGASLAAIADRHGLSRSLLFLWRKQAHAGLMPGVTPLVRPPVADQKPMFAPVVVAAPALRSEPLPVASRKQTAHKVPARTGCMVEISLGNGRVLKTDEGISPERLAGLVAALDR